jgi:hypothetical protein
MVTVEGPGTWTLIEIGDPVDGLGKGADITIPDESVGVSVGVMVGVPVEVDVSWLVTVLVTELVGVFVGVAVNVLVFE